MSPITIICLPPKGFSLPIIDRNLTSTASKRSARTIEISSMMIVSSFFTMSLSLLEVFFNCGLVGSKNHIGKLKKLCIVEPPILIAATPVGASNTNSLLLSLKLSSIILLWLIKPLT